MILSFASHYKEIIDWKLLRNFPLFLLLMDTNVVILLMRLGEFLVLRQF